jgi:hypothetical protein
LARKRRALVVGVEDFLIEARAGALHREERLEHPIAQSVRNARSVVADADAKHFRGAIDLRLDGDARRSAGGGARLDRVSQRRIAIDADVVIETFRPGVAERFGLGTRRPRTSISRP